MQTNATIIPTRSRSQAMDWSLVLASQGIQATLQIDPESRRWFLIVEEQDYEPAMAAIRQYRLENRGWNWKQKLEWSGVMFHWGVLLWCILLGLVYWFDAAHGNGLRGAGMMDSAAVRKGEWWRVLTAVSLHSNVGHLAANLTTGFLLLGLAMARYGAGVSLLAAYLAGGIGNLAGLFFYQRPYHGLGASGMVMGALGLMTVQSLSLWRESSRMGKFIASGIMGGVLMFIFFGLNPESDVVAHLGGFVGGCLLGCVLALLPAAWVRNNSVNVVASLFVTGLFMWTWWKALS
jgi:rhomboid protease GluP